MGKILILLFFVFVLSACASDPAVRLRMATGGAAGTYYPLGRAMAGVIFLNTDININVMTSGASADNIRQIAAGTADLAIAQNDVMSYAFHGSGIWAGREPVTNLATLMSLYPETIQIVVRADSDIFSVSELAGRRVSIGDEGSGVEANALQILDVHGLTSRDISALNMGFSASADAMRDRLIDAFFVTSATPNAAVLQLAEEAELRLLPISESVLRLLKSRYPFYTVITMDYKDYPWLPEPVDTVAVKATLITSIDMYECVAYDIVSTLIINQEYIPHPRAVNLTPYNAVQSVSVEFHPGARRFFEQIGALEQR